MTTDEIIEGMIDGSLDTHRWEDALAVARDLHDRNGLKIIKACDTGQSWLFLSTSPPVLMGYCGTASFTDSTRATSLPTSSSMAMTS